MVEHRSANPKVWGSIPQGDSELFLCLTLVTRQKHLLQQLSSLQRLHSWLQLSLNPFTPKISLVILLTATIQLFWCKFREFGIGSTNNTSIDSFLYSHHLSVWCCIDIVQEILFGSIMGVWGLTWWSDKNCVIIAVNKNSDDTSMKIEEEKIISSLEKCTLFFICRIYLFCNVA